MDIELENKTVHLNFDELDTFQLEEILTIDYSKLKEEISTFFFVCNQLGFLLNEANNNLRKAQLQLDILNDRKEEFVAAKFLEVQQKLIGEGIKNPTLTLVNSQIVLQKGYKELQESLKAQKLLVIKLQKEKDDLNSLYWSAQNKSQTLQNLSKNINPNDI